MNIDFQIGIVGAGFGGLVAALRLKNEGKDSFVVFERAKDIGGTWRDNTYPGCGCDVPSHLYSFKQAPKPDWSLSFSLQPEIWDYMKDVVDQHDLRRHIRCETDIIELRYLEGQGCWQVTDRKGGVVTVKVLVLSMGPLNRPSMPKIKGLDTFQGKVFHSSEWDHNYDLNGKRVAVIGTGASSIQIVPNIAPLVSQLTVFQRSAAWVTPRRNRKISVFEKWLFKNLPFTQKAIREGMYWFREWLGKSFVGNKTIHALSKMVAMKHLKKHIKDPELRAELTPNYEIGCKRILISDDYYPAFNRPNVQLVTSPIAEVTPTGLLTEDGKSHPADAIVCGTGFVAADIEMYTRVSGLGGRSLNQEWAQHSAEGYRGTTVSGYPNLTFILGPNTGLGHNTVVHMMESQMNYIMGYLRTLEQLGEGKALDVKMSAQKAYNEDLQKKFAGTVWASGCKSWYIDSRGRNTALYPRLTAEFRKQTKVFDASNYDVV